jgi:hypothetical protein
MRTETITIYRFAELSEKARQRAKDEYAELFGYERADEALDSMRALARHFDGRVTDWEIDFFRGSHSSMKFSMPDDEPMTKAEIRRRLKELGSYNRKTGRGDGECKLTGVCWDEDAIDGFRLAFRQGETDLDKLMQAAFESWLKACHADCEDFYSDETFGEFCEGNEYEFYEDGRFHAKKG